MPAGRAPPVRALDNLDQYFDAGRIIPWLTTLPMSATGNLFLSVVQASPGRVETSMMMLAMLLLTVES
jgi:hypothetical protein